MTKSFDGRVIIDHINCHFVPGCYAVTGPNGAGKSTFLSLLSGSISADSGTILINGYDLEQQPVQAKSLLSYVPDQTQIYSFITGKEFLDFVAYSKNQIPSRMTCELVEEFEIKNLLM